ncbi:MAG: VWA domain-containing protein [Planctomycetaceae bacterium]|nr:VWA domain-containing protein [Planctomycetaceae bacterium]
MTRISLLAAWLFVAFLAASAFGPAALGQGVLVWVNPPHPIPLPRPIPHPRPTPPPMSYKIKELDYHAKVVDQVAQVQVSQSFVNTGSAQMEVSFVFPLPYDGAIDRMTFMVDGKEYDAKLLKKEDARRIYEGYVRQNRDPALLEWVGYGMFQTSVFPVPAGAERKVSLKFSQLLRKNHQLTDLMIPLSTAKYTSQPVEKLAINVAVETAVELKSVYSPTHAVNVQRPDNKHAIVKFEATHTVPTADFRLLFDTADGQLGASLLSYRPDSGDDGFFLLLASPEVKAASDERPAKTVIFVVDRSGSMSGKKIEQAKEALKFVLNNLRQGDTFNIVAYDSAVEAFKPELQKYDDETRKSALGFVDGLYAGGSTNIDGALTSALGMITDTSRPSYILFLTDGLPTAGETNEAKIVENTRQNNKHRVRMINFGVGYDLNSRLLDRLSRENFGQSEFVRPDENIEAHVSRLYGKMSSPVMTGLEVKVDVDAAGEGGPVNRVYPKRAYDLFAGEQLVMVGRYKRPGGAKVTVTGKVGNADRKFDFPGTLVEKSNDQSYAFVEKLWAMRRIGEIIDELDLKGKNDELVTELVTLSTKHGILTQYTSFLADENAPRQQLADLRGNTELTRKSLERLEATDGLAGVAQRFDKNALQLAERAASAPSGAFGAGLPADSSGGQGRVSGSGPQATRGAGLGGYGGGRTANFYRDAATDREVEAKGVQVAGKETLYKRGKLWIAANAQKIDPDKDTDKIKRVKRFSDDYFILVRDNTADENAVLAAQQEGEELLVVLRGQAYYIE